MGLASKMPNDVMKNAASFLAVEFFMLHLTLFVY
jgi:hypothetical protein